MVRVRYARLKFVNRFHIIFKLQPASFESHPLTVTHHAHRPVEQLAKQGLARL
jgi:hypothetical protein